MAAILRAARFPSCSLRLRPCFAQLTHPRRTLTSPSLPAVDVASLRFAPLEDRSLLRLRGEDASKFLQGLVTHDMRRFETYPSLGAQYAFFLNHKGRVLFDSIIYRDPSNPQAILLESDKAASPALESHMRRYILRSKLTIEKVADDLRLFAALRNPSTSAAWDATTTSLRAALDPEDDSPSREVPDARGHGVRVSGLSAEGYHAVFDPREASLGLRVLLGAHVRPTHVVDVAEYSRLRYERGVAEGAAEIAPDSLPLELFLEELNGVSFHKGCYLGQELTARTHATGVIRKCLFPIEFDDKAFDASTVPPNTDVLVNGSSAGKFRRGMGNRGFAHVRIAKVFADATGKSNELSVAVDGKTHTARARVPSFVSQALLAKAAVGDE